MLNWNLIKFSCELWKNRNKNENVLHDFYRRILWCELFTQQFSTIFKRLESLFHLLDSVIFTFFLNWHYGSLTLKHYRDSYELPDSNYKSISRAFPNELRRQGILNIKIGCFHKLCNAKEERGFVDLLWTMYLYGLHKKSLIIALRITRNFPD